mmetsp:Transcript_56147/g.130734  ORF Transcript_56147/g.130734 Transcript_56147/m.130734 type:complete len:466 (-) Transcript_56147:86-1483(-)|eukprot:CAMPEP_0171108108 /NCGR_PEP_ID=MMETSP0766_2-20121228/68184_1 /TAXON_ID=439317 /ORGANISM="Gambierdiscus australes, Strain CAWD 149" /LENGTH=465 /DNA_ID=CAMNT_0011569547 /DNA_START=50 /DNA_END=1447 /DNA_ORIENTATION=+
MASRTWLFVATVPTLLLQVAALRVQPTQKTTTGSSLLAGSRYSQELGNLVDLQYYGHFDIGGQTNKGILDTGSFELVVFSARCSSCGIAGHYNESNSRTYRLGKSQKTHAYGSGTCLASDGYDTVSFGPFEAPNQALWLAQECEMQLLAHASFNAIVGLGPPGEPEQVAKSKLQDLENIVKGYEEQKLPVPTEIRRLQAETEQEMALAQSKPALLEKLGVTVFSSCLGREPGSPGWLVWNDNSHIEKSGVTRFPVTDSTMWGLQLTGVAIGNRTVGCTNGCGAVVDTGTSLFMMASELYDAVLQLLNSYPSQGVPLNCSDLRHFEDLVFTVGDTQLRFPPSSYLGEYEGQATPAVSSFIRSPEKRSLLRSRCELLIMDLGSEGSQGPNLILGMPFFREYYTSFSLGSGPADRSIYLSEADDSCRPSDGIRRTVDSHALRREHGWKPRRVDASKVRVSRKPESRSG